MFPAGASTYIYNFVTHVYSQPATISCSPYYSWPDDGTARGLGNYSLQINPPQLSVTVAPALSQNGTLHVEVSLTPANQYAVPFDLLSSAPTIITNGSSVIPIGGKAALDLPVQSPPDSTLILTAQINTPTGLLQATGRFSSLQLVTGTGVSAQDPTSVSKAVSGTLTARYPLGSTFFVQLARSNSDGTRTPIPSNFALRDDSITPAIAGQTLFPNNVAIEFDSSISGEIKYFQGIHMGTVNLSITPVDSALSPITVSVNISRPEIVVNLSAATASSADWIFKWTGTTTVLFGPTTTDVNGNLTTVLNDADFIDLTGDGIPEIVNPPERGYLDRPMTVYQLVGGQYALTTTQLEYYQKFVRGTGQPVTQTVTFSVADLSKQYTMTIDNGGGNADKLVSSAQIQLNGTVVAGPNQLNQRTRVLNIPVTVKNSNVLSVELRSAPGSELVITIAAQQ